MFVPELILENDTLLGLFVIFIVQQNGRERRDAIKIKRRVMDIKKKNVTRIFLRMSRDKNGMNKQSLLLSVLWHFSSIDHRIQCTTAFVLDSILKIHPFSLLNHFPLHIQVYIMFSQIN